MSYLLILLTIYINCGGNRADGSSNGKRWMRCVRLRLTEHSSNRADNGHGVLDTASNVFTGRIVSDFGAKNGTDVLYLSSKVAREAMSADGDVTEGKSRAQFCLFSAKNKMRTFNREGRCEQTNHLPKTIAAI